MAPRVLPGIGLQGFETSGASGWNGWADTNWRIISALIQARVKSVVATVPTSGISNGDMHILTSTPNQNAIAVRDNGAWVYITPQVGYRVYDEDTALTFAFDGSAWAPEFADLSASSTAPAVILRKRGSASGALAPNASLSTLGSVQFNGWTGSAWRVGAQIIAQTRELWSGVAGGSGFVLQLIANGATALVDKIRLTATELWVDALLTGQAAQRLGALWCTKGGSVNAITLTYGISSLAAGQKVRWRATGSNTSTSMTINLDGTGAIACRTITGVVPPIGYIRTDVDTEATYDGTYWVIDREEERGSNANGSWVRYACGKQECWHTGFTQTSTEAVGNIFRSAEETWTFPVAFINADILIVNASARNVARWASGRPSSATVGAIRQYSAVSSGVSVDCNVCASGFWY